MELFIHDLLTEYGIGYIPQARFKECRNIFPLPFDFYLYEYNTIVEYDGAQHVYPVDFFGGEEQYLRRIHNDNIKNEYCKENGINLIRLAHTLTTEQIKEIIIHIWNP
jgi:very-short-patch-repair endonuclease